MAQREFPLMHRMVMVIVWAISLRSGRGSRFNPELGPSDRWWSNFRKHHPELTLRKVDKKQVKEYSDLLKRRLTEHGLMKTPRRIYNCGETFLPLYGTCEKAVTVKHVRSTYAQACGTT